jgi:SAM-dependent methyltransferase
MSCHDQDLRAAFDGQAERFERSAVQADPVALARLVAFASPSKGARILDAGCGPGLVSEVFLAEGCHVHGRDLSDEMIARARNRCARFGERARFEQGSVFELPAGPSYDLVVSRYVVHHVEDPLAFVRHQAELLRPGGTLVVSDQTTDPNPARAGWHQDIERARDGTHTRHLTLGALVDLLTACGLGAVRVVEEPLELDFDEWFDRGTPTRAKHEVRAMVLAGSARGFSAEASPSGRIRLTTWRAMIAGTKTGIL